MYTGSSGKHHAPGIAKVLGASVFDIGLLGLVWFLAMIFMTALWTINESVSHAGALPNPQPGPFALLLIGISSLYISIMLLWAMRGRTLSVQPVQTKSSDAVWLAIGSGFSLCLFMMFCTWTLNHLGFGMRPGNQALLEEAGKNAPLFIAVFTIFVAPVFEELFFRKQLFARFQNAGHTAVGYVFSSILFALLHEPQPTQGLPAWCLMLLLYAAMGSVFAWVYQKTGKLWPAMLCHASNNLLAVGILYMK